MRKLSKEQILLLHSQLIEEFGGSDGVRGLMEIKGSVLMQCWFFWQ